MRTSFLGLTITAIVFIASAAHADQVPAINGMAGLDMATSHHMFTVDAEVSHGQDAWELDGWAGGDNHRLWLKSEGDIKDGHLARAELWAMYGRHAATWWDAQVGVREDVKPDLPGGKAHTYLIAGITGLAPYFFDTEAHVFVRVDGAVSARLRQENHWLITQRLVMRPRIEVNLNSRNDPPAGLGTGLTDVSLGVQTRYEIRREFAPYVAVTWRRKFGQTADYARLRGEKPDETRLSLGIRWMF